METYQTSLQVEPLLGATAEQMKADDEQFRAVVESLLNDPKIHADVRKELRAGLEVAETHGKEAYPKKTLREIFAEFIFSPDRLPENILESLSFSALIQKAEQAGKDALTGLANRWIIEKTLEEWVRSSREIDKEFGVVIFDVDHFKVFNDTYGHHIGDEVLKAFAQYLQKSFRPDDLVGRYGGEEFVVGMRASEEHIAEKLQEFWHGLQMPFAVEDHNFSITASAGWAFYDKLVEVKTSEQLLKEADAALYIAKASGRNRITKSGDDILTELREF